MRKAVFDKMLTLRFYAVCQLLHDVTVVYSLSLRLFVCHILRATACNASRVLVMAWARLSLRPSVCHTLQPYQNNAS